MGKDLPIPDKAQTDSVDVNVMGPNSSARVQADSEHLVPSLSLQILNLVHQLDVKLTESSTNLQIKMEALENKMEAIESKLKPVYTTMGTLGATVDSLKSAMATLRYDVGDDIRQGTEHLEAKLDVLKDRVVDKISTAQKDLQGNLVSLQNRIEDEMKDGIEEKLGQLYMKVTAFTEGKRSPGEDVRKSLNQSFTALIDKLNTDQEEVLATLNITSQNLVEEQSLATGVLLSAARNLTRSQVPLLGNLSMAVNEISEIATNISEILSGNFTSLLQPSLYVNNSAVETVLSTNESLSQRNTTAATTDENTTAAKTAEILRPKHCFNGTSPFPEPMYPYTLIDNKEGLLSVPYLCDTESNGGGWIVIQRRTAGDVDFYRGWEEYRRGFGRLEGDFYLGNDNIHQITSNGQCELRVEIVYQGKSAFAQYDHFSIAGESDNFRLNVTGYNGTAGDALATNNGQQFTTKDRDNDPALGTSCALVRTGAWWYVRCGWSNLNGQWGELERNGPFWHQFSEYKPVSFTEMKVRCVLNS